MKKLNTGVETREILNNIEVYSPYWIEPEKEFELTEKQMIKLEIGFFVIVWIFNLVLGLTLLNQ